ncbi:Uu.00g008520.m01.CDS01 [Anthostomella pinea]|uniref:Uu.00g008520.m01.CDS01 n=1 Tax=Anthostomella pinea TaxID=933095 RepID=A0AAI8VYF7_9PEZI|nr:Uu.00g008520.m01.CDS01 [Anthostomella pinea]
MRGQRRICECTQRLKEGVEVIGEISDGNSEDIQELRLGQIEFEKAGDQGALHSRLGQQFQTLWYTSDGIDTKEIWARLLTLQSPFSRLRNT